MSIKIQAVRKAAKGHNRYCGPAALSIVTGIDTAQAAALIRKLTKVRSVTGTTSAQLIRAFNALGYHLSSVGKFNPNDHKSNPTLAAWLKETFSTRGDDVYLIAAGHHWQVVQGRRLCCSMTQKPVSLKDDKVMRRARVTGVFKITYDRRYGKAIEDLLPSPNSVEMRHRKAEAAARAKAQRLAKQHNIEIEVERGYDGYAKIVVWGPDFLDDVDTQEADPYSGDHYAEDWWDALERVETYVKLIKDEPQWFFRYILEKAA